MTNHATQRHSHQQILRITSPLLALVSNVFLWPCVCVGCYGDGGNEVRGGGGGGGGGGETHSPAQTRTYHYQTRQKCPSVYQR